MNHTTKLFGVPAMTTTLTRSAASRRFGMFGLPTFKDVETNDVSEAIKIAGLDWDVIKKQSLTEDGRKLDNWYLERSDNGQIVSPSVGPEWTPVQNRVKFQWFQPYLDSGLFSLAGAGSLFGSQEVGILAKVKLPDTEIVKGDPVNMFIYIRDNFGKRAMSVCGLILRLVCSNGAMRQEIASAFKLRHSSKVVQKLDNVRDKFQFIGEEFGKVVGDYQRMASRPLHSQTELRRYIADVFQLEPDSETGKLATRSENTISEIAGLIPGPVAPITAIDLTADNIIEASESPVAPPVGTYWNGYNAVTDYLNHTRGRSVESRLDSLLYGNSALVEQRAYALALGA